MDPYGPSVLLLLLVSAAMTGSSPHSWAKVKKNLNITKGMASDTYEKALPSDQAIADMSPLEVSPPY